MKLSKGAEDDIARLLEGEKDMGFRKLCMYGYNEEKVFDMVVDAKEDMVYNLDIPLHFLITRVELTILKGYIKC